MMLELCERLIGQLDSDWYTNDENPLTPHALLDLLACEGLALVEPQEGNPASAAYMASLSGR